MKNRRRFAGRWLMIWGIIALITTLGRSASALTGMMQDGVFNAATGLDRQAFLMGVALSVAMILFGQAVCVAVRPEGDPGGERPFPTFIGWQLTALALLVGLLWPASSLWILLVPGVLLSY